MLQASRRRTLEQRRIDARLLAAAAVGLTTVMLVTSACGGASGPKAEVLKSANPLTSDLYLRINGPAGAVNRIARGAISGAFFRYRQGFFVPPVLRQHKAACSITHTIDGSDPADLQPWRGQKTTIAVYGNSVYAEIYCLGISSVFPLSS